MTFHRAQHQPDSRGMVTFELAVGILAAAVLTSILVWAISLVAVSTRCFDTATQVARQLSRGDTELANQARESAPDGAHVSVQHTATTVTVRVTVDQRLGQIGPITLAGEATAVLEPGVTP